MEATGLADFQRAKETILQQIKSKKEFDATAGFQQATGPVNIRAVTLPSISTLSRIQQVRAAAVANKARLQETVKNLGPLIANKQQEIANLKRFIPKARTSTLPAGIARNRDNAKLGQSFAIQMSKYNAGLKILSNQLADLVKKLQNALTLLRNT